jgi:predicted nucleic acid-binding protein
VIVYFDTSGLLKLFVDEAHTEEVRHWARAAEAIAASPVTLPEASAAIGRRHRSGGLTLASAHRLLREIAVFWRAVMVVRLDEVLAADLAFEHGLTGFDGVQLAGALTAGAEAPSGDLAFASFDLALNRAARAEGLTVLEPRG